MQFAQKWIRTVGGSGVVLGSGDPDPNTLGALEARDNLLQVRWRFDRPLGRLMVGWTYVGAGSPAALTVDAWVYEASSGAWYRLTATATALPLRVMTFLPVIGALPPNASNPELQNGNVYLQAIAAGGDPAGSYVFVSDMDQRVVV